MNWDTGRINIPIWPDWEVDKLVDGLPPGAGAEPTYSATDFQRQFGITTSCLTPPGTYTLTFHTAYSRTHGPGPIQSAQAKLTVSAPVQDSPLGTFTTAHEIDIRTGGPSSMKSAVADWVTFCDTIPPRRLRITVESALSKAGTRMFPLPRYYLLRAIRPGLQLHGEINFALASDVLPVAHVAGDENEWELAGGPYIIVFGEYYWGHPKAAEQHVSHVTYTLEAVQ